MVMDRNSTSPTYYPGLGPYSICSTDSTIRSPLYLSHDISKNNESHLLFSSRSVKQEVIPESFPESPSTKVHIQDLTNRETILNYFQGSDLKSSLLPVVLNDSMLSNIDDKYCDFSSPELSSNILCSSSSNVLPSLDHPLDFENLMDLDTLPLEK